MVISTDSIEDVKPVMTQSIDSLEGDKPAVAAAVTTASAAATHQMVQSTDSLESCSNNTRATASMLSSCASETSGTLIDELEHDNKRDEILGQAKKMLLEQGEIQLEDSDDSLSLSPNKVATKKTIEVKQSKEIMSDSIEKMDSSCEESFVEVDQYGVQRKVVVKHVVEVGEDVAEVVAERRIQHGLEDVSQAIFKGNIA